MRSLAFKDQGKVIDDAVSLFVENQIYSGWEEISFSKELLNLADSFNTTLIVKPGLTAENWKLLTGKSVKLLLGQDLVFSGNFEGLNISLGSRVLQLAGRSAAGDLVDCDIENPIQLKNCTLYQLFSTICSPFGIGVVNLSGDINNLGDVTIRPGSNVFSEMDKYAKKCGVIIRSRFDGNIEYFKSTLFGRSSTGLYEGVNILDAGFSDNSSERFSKYKAMSQSEQSLNVSGECEDEGVDRYRPKVIISESASDANEVKVRAQHEAGQRLAKAQNLNITVQGWRQENGELWNVGNLTPVKIPFFGIDTDLLISTVSFNKSRGGTTTSLGLVSPDSLNSEKKKVKKKDDLVSRIKWKLSKT